MKSRVGLAIVITGVGALTLPACHKRVTYYEGPSIEGFRFGAHATVIAGDTLRVTATAENVSPNTLREESGSCYWLNKLAVRAESKSKTWDSRQWEISRLPIYRDSAGREIGRVCAGGAIVQLLGPGALLKYEVAVPVLQILGDSLGSGTYRITARIAINGREARELRAGSVELRVPPT